MPRLKTKTAKLPVAVEPPRLGVVSQLFRGTPSEVASQILRYGLESVQLLPKFTGVSVESDEDATTAACEEMAAPFHDAELLVAGVSGYTNFIDPDRSRRRRQLKRFDALVEHCRDFGTPFIITESGTLNANRPWEDHPENHRIETLKLFVKHLKPSVRIAERAGVTILIEGHLNHVVNTPAIASKVRETLGEHVGFVMDPPNYFTRNMASSSKKPLKDLFTALGHASPVAHAKDVRYVGHDLTTPRAGTGTLDYPTYLELLGEYSPGGPLILEQVGPAELRETIDFFDRFFVT